MNSLLLLFASKTLRWLSQSHEWRTTQALLCVQDKPLYDGRDGIPLLSSEGSGSIRHPTLMMPSLSLYGRSSLTTNAAHTALFASHSSSFASGCRRLTSSAQSLPLHVVHCFVLVTAEMRLSSHRSRSFSVLNTRHLSLSS